MTPPAIDLDPEPSTVSSGRRLRPVKTVVLVLASVLALAAAAIAVVHAIDAAALARTRVFLDARSLSCKNPADVTTVTRGDDADPDSGSYAVPAVRGSATLDCRLSVVVQNDSDRTLEIDRVTFTLLGPDSRVGLRTDYAFTQGLDPSPDGDRADVVYDYADGPDSRSPFPVDAGTSRRFDFHLTSDGCRQAGASTTWPDSPAFTASLGTATEDLPLGGAGFGFIGVETTEQPCS